MHCLLEITLPQAIYEDKLKQFPAPAGPDTKDGGRWWSRTTDLHDVNVALYP
jgi:hypothetical protein